MFREAHERDAARHKLNSSQVLHYRSVPLPTRQAHGIAGSSSQNHLPVAFAPVSADAGGSGGGGGRLAVPRAGADLEGRRLRGAAAFRAGLGAGAAGPGAGVGAAPAARGGSVGWGGCRRRGRGKRGGVKRGGVTRGEAGSDDERIIAASSGDARALALW